MTYTGQKQDIQKRQIQDIHKTDGRQTQDRHKTYTIQT